jgi:hypothetical protein
LDPDLKWQPSPLPHSVKCFEIIDSTTLLNHWARYVLDHPTEFPSLKRVVLYCDKLTIPLQPDTRLRPEPEHVGDGGVEACVHPTEAMPNEHDHEPNPVSASSDGSTDYGELSDFESDYDEDDDGDYDSDDELNSENRKLDMEGLEVWEELQKAGVELVVNFQRDQGWRDT